ncbi:MAG: gamma-glutamyl-gamma-aminobutyrate hydrolase family protein [Cytophagales bacterium]|jgi:putative glutamine amidotransferase|nr:gamma-glutamyl-gamma-aminobutyrate hydrolase family protein [Cytophagales bacterium]MCA6369521.1 gamma-glutamyl-gamma-aminobutyrate hydrolase family protein [Cytophagales bacterium]MCA6373452.1 gamma-glutamyl-gamma-aminobutyrate hydrolase family protein [Cytophagales bacterium]MCA6375845.1 gamma-glutamyl-gamma-aminobutyrate hydrolase family protein [Cytophagales bacterium]MCA6386042.1 gamma-glutamyl-gamma-aminobutyrate hydrolase family protein [Cytophagales bacterium]
MKKITIGVADCSKYDKYAAWISQDADVEVIKLGYALNDFEEIKKCHGVLLTGGEDVHPRFYNKPELLQFCYPDDVDERRDEFDLSVINYTQQNNIPLLGICRGLQITNVFFGGTLIPDLPSFGKFNHSKFGEGRDRYHTISIDPHSQMNKISSKVEGEVNSAHHQSVKHVGRGLVANCFSQDGVIEGLERMDPKNRPYLMLVQWHPERMNDQSSPLTTNIKKSFLDQVRDL